MFILKSEKRRNLGSCYLRVISPNICTVSQKFTKIVLVKLIYFHIYKNCCGLHYVENKSISSCNTFWSTFLVLLFKRFCCSNVPLHITIMQCDWSPIKKNDKIFSNWAVPVYKYFCNVLQFCFFNFFATV